MLIGIVTYTEGHWARVQWFAETPDDEIDLLTALMLHLETPGLLVSFNGNRFDLPFIAARLAHNRLFSSPEEALVHLLKNHLHIDLLPISKLLPVPLPNYRLKTIEHHLGISRLDTISGGESVLLYQQYEKKPTADLLDAIMLHNSDDIDNMIPLWQIFHQLPQNQRCILEPQLTSQGALWKASIDQYLLIEGLTSSKREFFHHFGPHKIMCTNFKFQMSLQLTTIIHEAQQLVVVRFPDFPTRYHTLPAHLWTIMVDNMPSSLNISRVIDHILYTQ